MRAMEVPQMVRDSAWMPSPRVSGATGVMVIAMLCAALFAIGVVYALASAIAVLLR